MIDTKTSELIQAPPHAMELEEAVLGAAMIDTTGPPLLAQILEARHFYNEDHAEIYECIQALHRRRRPVDLLTVMEEARKRGSLERIGGPAALAALTNTVASAANTEYHARIIVQKWLSRELMKLGSKVSREAIHDDPFEVIESIGAAINSLSGFREDQAQTLYRASEDVLKQAEKAAESPEETIGFPLFGYRPLDDALQGVSAGDVVVITGPSGGGKSSLGNNAIINCEARDVPLYSWSSEMRKEDQARRFLSGKLDINGVKIAKGVFLSNPYDRDRVAGTVADLKDKKIFLDSSRMTLNRMVSTVSFYSREHGVRIFMFDRIELFDLNSISRNPDAAKDQIMTKARQLANEFGVTIIIYAQRRKGSDEGRPELDHIKGASEITQSATKVLYITRPEAMGILEDEEGRSTKGIGIIHILKSTHFDTGELRMRFFATRTRWEMDRDDLDLDQEADDLGLVPAGIVPIQPSRKNDDQDIPF